MPCHTFCNKNSRPKAAIKGQNREVKRVLKFYLLPFFRRAEKKHPPKKTVIPMAKNVIMLSNSLQFLPDLADLCQDHILPLGRWFLAPADILGQKALGQAQATGHGRGIQFGVGHEEFVER